MKATAAIGKSRKEKILRNAGHCILDVGCGDGRYVEAFSQRRYQIYGIDVAPRPCNNDLSRRVVKADARHLPFKDRSFDTVLMINVLEHVDDAPALQEAHRVCRKNVIFSVPHENEEELGEYNLTYHPYADLTHLRYYSIKQLHTKFASAGFEIREIDFEGPINPLGLFLRSLRLPRLLTYAVGAFINKVPGVKRYYMNIEGIAAKNTRLAERRD